MGELDMTIGGHDVRGIIRSASRRSMLTQASGGEITAWRPKIQVTRHLSPFEQEIISPPSKFFKHQGNMMKENAVDWVPAAIFFFGTYYSGNYFLTSGPESMPLMKGTMRKSK